MTFFLAPDDVTAAETRLKGPGPALTALACRDIDPDDAVLEWEMYFEAPSRDLPPLKELYKRPQPRYVAPIYNDGIGVFAVSDRLTTALATATPSELRELAGRWAERLRIADGDEMTDDDPLEVLAGVAQLAATADSGAGSLRIYCWYY